MASGRLACEKNWIVLNEQHWLIVIADHHWLTHTAVTGVRID
jgi:hypothetical protein